jgi:hypothetical protein
MTNSSLRPRTRITSKKIVVIAAFVCVLILPACTLCQETPPRKSNWRPVLLMTAASVGAAIVDVEASQHCTAAGTCQEANPLMPHNRAGMFGVKSGFAFGTTLEGFALRRSRSPVLRRMWWVPQAVYIASSTYGASTGLRLYGKTNPQVFSSRAR